MADNYNSIFDNQIDVTANELESFSRNKYLSKIIGVFEAGQVHILMMLDVFILTSKQDL